MKSLLTFKQKVKTLRHLHRGATMLLGKKRSQEATLKKLRALRDNYKWDVLIEVLPTAIPDCRDDDNFTLRDIGKDFARDLRMSTEKPANILIVRSSGWRESSLLIGRHYRWADIVVVWMRCNAIAHDKNVHLAAASDVYFPAHGFDVDYLQSTPAIFGGVVPVCSDQWSIRQARLFFEQHGDMLRSDKLYGGFMEYVGVGEEREELIRACEQQLDTVLELRPSSADDRYMNLSAEGRFKDWCSHKVSLALPAKRDVACRLFDALLTGQVPIIPRDVHCLDQVISPELQEALPIVTFDEYSVQSVGSALKQALNIFDRDGQEGIMRRHRYAIENHMPIHRVQSMMSTLRTFAEGEVPGGRGF